MFPVGPTFSREPVPDSESVVRFQKGLDDAGQGVIDAVSELETALDAAPPVAVPLACLAASVHALYTRLVLVGGDPGVAAEVRVACLGGVLGHRFWLTQPHCPCTRYPWTRLCLTQPLFSCTALAGGPVCVPDRPGASADCRLPRGERS